MIFAIMELMGEEGARYNYKSFREVYDYLEAMQEDHRLIGIFEDNKLIGFCTFSICDDIRPYYEKDLWEFLQHEPDAENAYVEKMVCKKWNKQIRSYVENEICSRYPSVRYGVWHRYTEDNDELITVNRRVNHVQG